MHLDGYSGPQKDGWEALKQLAAASSLVITEEMPTSPYAQWSKVSTPLPPIVRPAGVGVHQTADGSHECADQRGSLRLLCSCVRMGACP